MNNLLITTPNSIKFQSSILSQLTRSTNQLTRNTLVKISSSFSFKHFQIFFEIIALDRCYQLARVLNEHSTQISYEDAHFTINQLLQCATNILTVRDFK